MATPSATTTNNLAAKDCLQPSPTASALAALGEPDATLRNTAAGQNARTNARRAKTWRASPGS
eukprot:11222659-Lingulodinium_polyedra.AAC.1